MRALIVFAVLALLGCAPPAPSAPSLNALAEQYVRASLEMGTHEEGYIDAYYGPPEWKAQAEAHPRTTAQLKTIQEVITLAVFCVFSVVYLKEELRWNTLVGFGFMIAAVFFVFKKA